MTCLQDIDFAAARSAVARGESLPPAWYTRDDIAALDMACIIEREWQYIGAATQLSRQGDFVTGTIGRVPVVVVHDGKGLNGFVNVCRHRRHQVMKGEGNACRMRCPYHAWTYDLAGALVGLPRADELAEHAREELALMPVRVETLGPFVFAHLDGHAEPLTRAYPHVIAELERAGIDLTRLVPFSTQRWRIAGNWKNALENFQECYHCAVAHPELSTCIDLGRGAYALHAAGREMRQSFRDRGEASGGTGDAVAKGTARINQFHLLYPNLTINSHAGPSNLSIDVWRPDGASWTVGSSTHFFDPAADPAFIEEVMTLDERVGEQDADLVASVQEATMGAWPGQTRLLPESERLVMHFQQLVVDSLATAARASSA